MSQETLLPKDINSKEELDREIKKAWQEGDTERSKELHQIKEELINNNSNHSNSNNNNNHSGTLDSLRFSVNNSNNNNNNNNNAIVISSNNDNIDNDNNNDTNTYLITHHSNNNNQYSHISKYNNNNNNKIEQLSENGARVIEVSEENHKRMGEFVKSIIYGGLDGIMTTFAIVSAVHGADLQPEVVLVLGFANLVADGFSMGVGDYLSESAEYDFKRSERNREKWEFDNFQEGEISEMIEIYEKKGIEKNDAEVILRTMAKYPDFFINHMMIEELNIQPVEEGESAIKNGLVTMISFMAFGCVPLLTYLVTAPITFTGYDPTFIISIFMTILTLLALGALKGKMTESNMLKSAGFVMLNGVAAAGASYLVGFGLSQITDVSSS